MHTEETIAALERAPRIVVPLVRQAAPAIVKRRPPSGKWSIHEHACHLAEVHPLLSQRLDLMLAEDNPAIQSYDPGRDDRPDGLLAVDLEVALRRFEEDRKRLVGRLRQLQPDDWTRTATHEEYNCYSVFTMFRHLALHDFFHAYRIEELLLRKDWPAPDA
jgi:DinB superfamily